MENENNGAGRNGRQQPVPGGRNISEDQQPTGKIYLPQQTPPAQQPQWQAQQQTSSAQQAPRQTSPAQQTPQPKKKTKQKAAAPAQPPAGGYSRRPRLLTLIMLFVLVACLVIDSACAYDLFGRTNVPSANTNKDETSEEASALLEETESLLDEQESRKKELNEEGSISYSPRPAESDEEALPKVTDRSGAEKALAAMAGELGITDPGREYDCVADSHYDFGSAYTMQQYYNGIPIYGGTLKMTVDENGDVIDVSGNYTAIADFDTSCSLSESQAKEALVNHLKSNGAEEADLKDIKDIGRKIYIRTGAPVIIYQFSVSGAEYLVDGNSGDILEEISNKVEETSNVTLNGQNSRQYTNVPVEIDGANLTLASAQYGYIVYDAGGANGTFLTKNTINGSSFSTLTNQVNFTAETVNTVPAQAADIHGNLLKIYRILNEEFSRSGMDGNTNGQDTLFVFYNFSKYDNACYIDFETVDVICLGLHNKNDNIYTQIDTLGHEFTHGIVAAECSEGGQTPPAKGHDFHAINEGLADLFGEFYEFYDSDTNGCNWDHNIHRSAKSTKGGQAANYNSFHGKNKDCHDGAYLVTHPAYLMSQGIDGNTEKQIGMDDLTDLYYRILSTSLSYSETYVTLRHSLEMWALVMTRTDGLTDKQVECVMDALDKVEIPPRYDILLTPDGKVRFVDENKNPFPKAKLRIYKKSDHSLVYETPQSGMNGEVSLDNHVQPGIYDVDVILSSGDVARSFTMAVNDKVNKKDPYKTLEVLQISATYISVALDVSGSMSGTPMTSAKEAACRLVSVLYQSAPWARISIVTYSGGSSTLVKTSNNASVLFNAINGISSGGGTNMYSGFDAGLSLLKKGTKKMMFILGDGMPNDGKKENGSYKDALVSRSRKAQGENITVYALGFFHSLSGSDQTNAQDLMRSIASPGYYYNVASPDSLSSAFTYIASSMVNIGKTIHIEAHCPVDISVSYNGQTLNSAAGSKRNISTDFGLLTFEGENNEVKVLNLRAGPEYDICLTGTGKGKMDYTIAFADENGEYTDERTFNDVPLTKTTVITTGTNQKTDTRMEVDSDGDGKTDLVYTAKENADANREEQTDYKLYVIIGVSALALILLLIQILLMVRRSKKNKVCGTCGAPRNPGDQFCRNCASPMETVSVLFPKKVTRRPQTKGKIIAKLVVIVLAAGLTAGAVSLYTSTATEVYKKMTDGSYTAASVIYKKSMSGSKIEESYLSLITRSYLSRVDKGLGAGTYASEDVIPMYRAVSKMKLGEASDRAKELLKSRDKDGDTAAGSGPEAETEPETQDEAE